jgi:predicted TIM-barrel fold metal-dependent hydrolase
MEELEKRQAVMIIHPSKPPVVPENCFTSGPLPLLEFINDTTRAVVNLIATGTLERYPHVRVVVPHCGSFLPNIIDRLTGITKVLAAHGMGQEVDVTKSLSSLYFDLAGDIYPRGLAIVRTLADDDHLLFGGDFPYTPVPVIAGKVEKLLADEGLSESREKILYQNAHSLFGLGVAE